MLMLMVIGVLLEGGVGLVVGEYEGGEVVVGIDNVGGWVIYDSDELGVIGEGGVGVAALYSCSA